MTQLVLVNLHYQECDIRIDRQSPYGNPWRINRTGKHAMTRRGAIQRFAKWIRERPDLVARLRQDIKLSGKDVVRLGCWCKPEACHGDILIEMLKEGR